MFKSLACLLMIAAVAQSSQVEKFKRESVPLQAEVDRAVTSTGARVSEGAKASYLDGYGMVVVMQVILEQPPNPFSSAKTADEVRAVVAQRRKQIRDKLADLLKARIGSMDSVGPSESVAMIVHLLNTTRADVPDLPTQLILSIKKSAPTEVNFKEF